MAPFWSSSLPARPTLLSSKRQKMTHGLPRCKKSRPRGRQEHQRPPQDLPQGSPSDLKLDPRPPKSDFKDDVFTHRCFSSLRSFSSLFSLLFAVFSSFFCLFSSLFSLLFFLFFPLSFVFSLPSCLFSSLFLSFFVFFFALLFPSLLALFPKAGGSLPTGRS